METCDPGARDALRPSPPVHKNVLGVNSSTRRGALMKVRTALVLSALLLAVLGWACEQGPTSPSALGAPGGGSLGAAGGVSLDAAGGVISGLKPTCDTKPGHPSCKDEEIPTYTVTVAGDITGGPYNTNHDLGVVVVKDSFVMDISFFQNKVTCRGNPPYRPS